MAKTKVGSSADVSGLDLHQVASYLEVDPGLINEWASKGRIPGKKVNNAWRFEKAVVDEWILKEKVK